MYKSVQKPNPVSIDVYRKGTRQARYLVALLEGGYVDSSQSLSY